MDWCLPSTSRSIQSSALKLLAFSTPWKGFRVKIRNEALCALGKTGRIGLYIVRYFQKILWTRLLHVLISRKALNSLMGHLLLVTSNKTAKMHAWLYAPHFTSFIYGVGLSHYLFGAVSRSYPKCCLQIIVLILLQIKRTTPMLCIFFPLTAWRFSLSDTCPNFTVWRTYSASICRAPNVRQAWGYMQNHLFILVTENCHLIEFVSGCFVPAERCPSGHEWVPPATMQILCRASQQVCQTTLLATGEIVPPGRQPGGACGGWRGYLWMPDPGSSQSDLPKTTITHPWCRPMDPKKCDTVEEGTL